MEALALSLIIGTALLLSGIRLGGLARWAMAALGLAVLLMAMNRGCQIYPDFCSLDWLFRDQVGPPTSNPSLTPSLTPTIAPTTPDITPTATPLPPLQSPVPTPTTTPLPPVQNPIPTPTTAPLPPVQRPVPTPTPLPPVQRPAPTPTPSLPPCTGGNCPCVDYKCLW